MIHQDPNHIFLSIMGNVIGTICAIPVVFLQHIDLTLKITLSLVGLISYGITIAKNIKEKRK